MKTKKTPYKSPRSGSLNKTGDGMRFNPVVFPDIILPPGKKVYFASDFHLGGGKGESSSSREKKILEWLDEIAPDAGFVFLVGDLFDFWFEYRHVVPKGFLHFQAKLVGLKKRGIEIVFFTGNHDMWMFGYFTQELGIPVFRKPVHVQINGTRILVAHGDGLGPKDRGYKILKKVFENRFCRWLFSLVHPDLGIFIAQKWAAHSWKKGMENPPAFQSAREWLWQYAQWVEKETHHDYYVFGHRHIALRLPVGDSAEYINLGEWIHGDTYAVFDGKKMEFNSFKDKTRIITLG